MTLQSLVVQDVVNTQEGGGSLGGESQQGQERGGVPKIWVEQGLAVNKHEAEPAGDGGAVLAVPGPGLPLLDPRPDELHHLANVEVLLESGRVLPAAPHSQVDHVHGGVAEGEGGHPALLTEKNYWIKI